MHALRITRHLTAPWSFSGRQTAYLLSFGTSVQACRADVIDDWLKAGGCVSARVAE
jgi:hypothetical protein